MGVLRHGRMLLLGLVAVLASSCATMSQSSRTTEFRGPEAPSSLNLLTQFPVAVRLEPPKAITFTDPADRAFLPSGWSTFETRKDGESLAYGRGARSVVEVPIVNPKRMSVSVSLSSLPRKDFPMLNDQAQEVAAYWNGTLLRTMTLTSTEPETFSMTVRSDLQRYGLNLFELRPWYWVRTDRENFGPPEEFGFRCHGIDFSDYHGAPRTEPAFHANEDGMISQGFDSAFAEFVSIPRDAVLTGRVRVVSQSAFEPEEGRGLLVISLLDENGVSTVLDTKRFTLARESLWIDLEIPLDAYADQMAGFTFSFHSAGADPLKPEVANAARLEWRQLKLDGLGPAQSPPERDLDDLRAPYNVILVLFDTLRADHTEPYAETDVRTPVLLELADQGVTFTEASSNAPWTRPSVASLMTGNYPWVHQALRLGDKLPPDMPTLPRLLKRNGYRTIAVVNNNVVSDIYGFAEGFEAFHQIYETYDQIREVREPQARAERVWTENIEPFLKKDSSRPFFIYLHELDPHSPYLPPPPFDTMYSREYQSFVKSGAPFLVNEGLMTLRPEDVGVMLSQYKGEISFMDAYLGWILDYLEKADLLENTLLVFTSDHGEEFLEHGGLRHGDTLYEEQLTVPMMFSLEGTLPKGARIPGAAESVDITPTVLDLLGLRQPAFIQGRSLLPQMAPRGGQPLSRPTFAHNNYRYSIKWDGWKLVKYHDRNEEDVRTGIHNGYDFELFNLDEDPGETLNLWSTRYAAGKALHQRLLWDLFTANIDSRLRGEEVNLDDLAPDMVEDLKTLGYL